MNILNRKFYKHLRAYSFSAHPAIRFLHRLSWKLYKDEFSAFLLLHPNSELNRFYIADIEPLTLIHVT